MKSEHDIRLACEAIRVDMVASLQAGDKIGVMQKGGMVAALEWALGEPFPYMESLMQVAREAQRIRAERN